nr:immunoglobulin heavy chain junction region [Macaca mulatta]MOV37953.1 immunoglobulin heavy chain junction region [Macaca mulatta]MOV37997.1 immunoglobulin heavy chain junction region [Macaca mulatta]MOV38323.1 immunoglobulin heavy chain junction region [Macaca mulatta]MOV38645.1 immunoglobulin heavy chain junction region [Macaca mulatta]
CVKDSWGGGLDSW